MKKRLLSGQRWGAADEAGEDGGVWGVTGSGEVDLRGQELY